MINDLIVTHFKKDSLVADNGQLSWQQCELFQASAVWETCVRVLGLSSQNENPFNVESLISSAEIFQGAQAYHFLLRVTSGLESPILGETEVFGQFKNWLEQSPKWRALGQMILEDVKMVRRQYLEGLGAQSYGSWARKKLENQSRVMMYGCGQLGQEILPWLGKADRHVTVVVRNPERYQHLAAANVEIVSEQQVQEWAGALLILAPLSDQHLSDVLEKSAFQLIVDLRDISAKFWGQKTKEQPVFTLEDAFADLKKFRELGQSQIAQAEQKLQELARTRAQSVQNRPFGWDDLCA